MWKLPSPDRLPPVLGDAFSEAIGASSRTDPVLPGSGGPAGNARLTAWTGLILLVLSIAELLTLFDVQGLISWHVVIGVLLVPPALLKTVSTGWRIVRYYAGRSSARMSAYVVAGPPPLVLRLLGPAVVISTLSLLGSGLVLVFLGSSGSRNVLIDPLGFRVDWVTLHQLAFIVWAVATGLHVLGRFVPALRLTLVPRTSTSAVPGARRRVALLFATSAVAVVASVLVLGATVSWQLDGDHDAAQDLIGLSPSW